MYHVCFDFLVIVTPLVLCLRAYMNVLINVLQFSCRGRQGGMRASRSSGSSSPASSESQISLASSVPTSMPLMKLDLFGAAYQDQDRGAHDSVCVSTNASTNASSQQPSEAASSVSPLLLPLRSVGKLPSQQGAIGGRSMCANRSPAHQQPSELARIVKWKLELAEKKRSYHTGSKLVGGKRTLDKSSAAPIMSSWSDSGKAEGESRFSAEDTSADARDGDGMREGYDAAVQHHATERRTVSSVEAKKMLQPPATWVAASNVTCEGGGGAERGNVARGRNSDSGGEEKKVADTAAAEPPAQRGNDSGNTLRRRGAMTADFLRGFWEDFAPEARTNVMALHLNGKTAAQIKNHHLLVDYDLTEAAVLAIIYEDQENAKAQTTIPPPLRLEQSSVESVLRAWYLPLRERVRDHVTSPHNLSLSSVPRVDDQVACTKSKEPREIDYSVPNCSGTRKTKSPSIVMSSQPLPHHQHHQLIDEFHLFPGS